MRSAGSQSAAARALGIKLSTFRNILRHRGAESADRHGNAMPPSSMRFGWSGEDHAAMILGGTHHRVTGHESFDLVWHGKRVEVKTARPCRAGKAGDVFWMFNVARSHGKFDLLFCIGCNEEGLPLAYYMLPAAIVPRIKLSIPTSGRSKWSAYGWQPEPAALPSYLLDA